MAKAKGFMASKSAKNTPRPPMTKKNPPLMKMAPKLKPTSRRVK